MKKLFFLLALTVGISSTTVFAQEQRDPAAMAQRMKERVKPQLIEKTKLSDAEAEKVLDINIDMRMKMRDLRDLAQDERQKKMDEMNKERDAKYKAIPLTDDQIKKVNDFFEEQRQQMRQQRQNGGGGGR
jgi:Spy/CpxP family protein refolding chaperone